MNKQLKKYLNTRAITSPWSLDGSVLGARYRAAIIIPALAESQTLPQTLTALSANPVTYLRQTMVVVVVNNRQSASAVKEEDNRHLLAWLKSEPLSNLNLTWVDASSDGKELPFREGVGLARKIGFDLSLAQLDWTDGPLLVSLDADTLVEDDYVPAIFRHFEQAKWGGAVIPFRHQSGQTEIHEKAIRTYELYLRSYLLGLQWAGSPYAYHTIGSAFACRASAYLAAGGMNRRLAAEDFYFLQQLAKVSGVETIKGTVVHPSPRFSNRVPFGTGRAVQAQVDEDQYLFNCSSGRAFQVLKCWLDLVADNFDRSPEYLLEQAGQIAPELHQFLSEYNFKQIWERFQRQHRDSERLIKAFHDWFDALKTRQVVSRIDGNSPLLLEERIEDLLSVTGNLHCDTFDKQLALLEQLQLNE